METKLEWNLIFKNAPLGEAIENPENDPIPCTRIRTALSDH